MFHFGCCLRQSSCLVESKFSWGNHISVAEWPDTYGIHHWRNLWSSYRKLACVGLEPATTEFRSDAWTDWAIRSWVRLSLRARFVQLPQFYHFLSVRFCFGCWVRQLPPLFWLKFSWGNDMSVAEWPDTYGIYYWKIFWRSYRKLAGKRFEPATTDFRSDTLTGRAIRPSVQPILRANIVQLLQFHHLFTVRFNFECCLHQSPRLF